MKILNQIKTSQFAQEFRRPEGPGEEITGDSNTGDTVLIGNRTAESSSERNGGLVSFFKSTGRILSGFAFNAPGPSKNLLDPESKTELDAPNLLSASAPSELDAPNLLSPSAPLEFDAPNLLQQEAKSTAELAQINDSSAPKVLLQTA